MIMASRRSTGVRKKGVTHVSVPPFAQKYPTLWARLLEEDAFMRQLDSDNQSRFPVRADIDEVLLEQLLAAEVECGDPRCRRLMHPFRAGKRADGSRGTVMFYMTGPRDYHAEDNPKPHTNCSRHAVVTEYMNFVRQILGKVEYQAVQPELFDPTNDTIWLASENIEEQHEPAESLDEDDDMTDSAGPDLSNDDVNMIASAIVGETQRLLPHRLTLADEPFLETRQAVEELLLSLKQDISTEDLRDTPRRVAAFYQEQFKREAVNFTTFANPGIDEMVVQRDIPFYSLCEHHMVPFFGIIAIAYIPSERIVGLSKLTRLAQMCSKGLQTQERITKAIADELSDALEPHGVGVLIRARHLCMEMRGVKSIGSETLTSDLRGALRDSESARLEFLTLTR